MPDVDLQLVMAEGDFLQRVGDELVGSVGPVGDTGPAGPTGPAGADSTVPGPPGDPGEVGGSLLSAFWSFATATSTPPSGGQMRTDATFTNLYVNETDTDGFARAVGLGTVAVGNLVYVRAANGTGINFLVTGTPVDNGTWWTFPISTASGGPVTKGARTQLNFLTAPPVGIPAGGTDEQVLAKTSSVDYAVTWKTIPSIVVKSTEPTAADYGLTTIPVGAIWVTP